MPAIRRILVAVKDPWARRLPALDKAVQLARAFGARVRIFHGMADPVYIDVADVHGNGLMSLEQAQRARVAGRLETLARHAAKRGVTVTTAVEWDFPAHEAVIRSAREFRADLIVAERHPTPHHAAWLLRFTDFELLRLSPVPVLLVKTRGAYARPRVLAAVDPSHSYAKPLKLDREILRYASTITHALHGSLHTVYAFDPLPVGAMAAELPLGDAAEVIEGVAAARARKALDRTLNGTHVPASRQYMVPRHPIDAIEGVAREIGSSIVVMGVIARSGLKRLVLGNTAERVLDQLPCDVLVVKPKRFTSHVPRGRRGAQLIALSALQPGI